MIWFATMPCVVPSGTRLPHGCGGVWGIWRPVMVACLLAVVASVEAAEPTGLAVTPELRDQSVGVLRGSSCG